MAGPDRHPDRHGDEPPLTALFAQVIGGIGRLIRGEFALARAEAREEMTRASRALAQLAIAGVLALVALNVLAGAAVSALVAAGLGPVWSPVVVGVVLILLAFGYMQYGVSLWRGRRGTSWWKRRGEGLKADLAALGGETRHAERQE